MTAVIKEFFTYFSAIDIHDHYRQGSLALQDYWQTKSWVMRMWSTVLGMIITDAYLMFRHDYSIATRGDMKKCKDFLIFVDELAYDLIHNDIDAPVAARLRARPEIQDPVPFYKLHRLIPLSNFDNTRMYQQVKCRVPRLQVINENTGEQGFRACRRKTSFTCHECALQVGEKYFGICNSHDYGCWHDHLEKFDPNNGL
jgi:hypothetical protein